MAKIIWNAHVYSPQDLEIKDVLVLGDKTTVTEDEIRTDLGGLVDLEETDRSGKILTLGFIDYHTHILGGGGEGGFSTRTPEIALSTSTPAGVISVVGTLGTDRTCRSINVLLVEARGLGEEGVSSYTCTGAYQTPTPSLTGDVMKDIMVIDKVIGVGEIVLSDHRSSRPIFEESVRLATNVQVAGMLSGKAGIINIHMGNGKTNPDYLNRAVEEIEPPIYRFLPTHMGRNPDLLEEGIKYMKKGGYCDLTRADDPDLREREYGEVRISKALKGIIGEEISYDLFTFTSDSQGPFLVFDESNNCIGLGMGKSSCLLEAIQECVFKEDIPLEITLKGLTINPTKTLKLKGKGQVLPGYDADSNLLDEKALETHSVFAKGKVMVQDRKLKVLGTSDLG